MSYSYDPDDYAEDPFANPYGMDEQAMVDFLVANGAGAGMLPMVQPGSGKALTVANRTSALNANRSALFDTAFQGLGGAQAFAPNAFEPTVSTTIKQTPELQQMYSYLRAPDSYEGLIANEILNGGNSSTALRKIRELLANENTDPALKDSLLLELPQRPVEYGMPALDRTVENVNWDVDENSVAERARVINELHAQIPRVGPSGPQWDPQTGQMISSGGDLHWGEDESGNPVLMETTVTESEAAKTFSDLGLPNPAEEYTAEDFMTPDQIAMQQAYAEYEEPVAQLKQAWMDPALAPTNTNGPNDRPWEAPANLTEDQLAGTGGGGNRPMTPEEQAAYALAKVLYNGNPIASAAGRAVEGVAGIPAALGLGPLGAVAQQIAGGGAPNPLVAGPLSAVAGGGWRGADELAQAAMGGLGSLFGSSDPAAAQPQQGNPDQIAQLIALLTQAAQGNESVDLDPGGLLAQGGWAGEGVNVDELMRRRAAMNAPGVPPPLPPAPGPDDYPAGDPATYEEFLAQQAATHPSPGVGAASGNPFSINLASAPYQEGGPIPPATINGQPNPAYQDYLDTLLPGQFRQPRVGAPPPSETAPWTAQPQIGAPPPSETAPWTAPLDQPARTPAYARPGAQPANQPGGSGFQNPQIIDAMLAQLLPGNQQRSTSQPPDWPQQRLPSGQVQQTGPTGREDWMRAQTLTGAGGGQGSNAMPATPYWAAGGVGNQAMTDAMLSQLLPGNEQRSTSLRAYNQQGATPAPQPGGAQYMEGIETGERRATQRQTDERNAQVLGGSTDRTGRRVRPTRTGEQARQYRQAFEAWDLATDEQQRAKEQAYSFEAGRAGAQAWLRRAQGVRPLDQALMARRLVLMNAGMPQGI